MTKAKWFILDFDDYHEIYGRCHYESVELGCFPPNPDICKSSCYRYYGLFYMGKKPKLQDIVDELKSLIDVDVYVSMEGENTEKIQLKLEHIVSRSIGLNYIEDIADSLV